MEELASSNISLENENKERQKPGIEGTPEEDEFDLAYKMIKIWQLSCILKSLLIERSPVPTGAL